jgi:methyl-accepting chemotaxis protein
VNSLKELRSSFGQGIIVLIWVNVCLIAAAAFSIAHVSALVATGSAVLIALGATVTWKTDQTGPATRIVTSMALAAQVALLVYAFSSHRYQIDIHMYFFATLAVCAGWCDWRAIVAYAAVTAIHHLLLNFILPAAVFPDGADLWRVIVHAVILVMQTAVLIWIVHHLQHALESSETAAASAETARKETERAAEAAATLSEKAREESGRAAEEQRRSMDEQTQVVRSLKTGLGKLASGDLTFQLTEQFPGAYEEIKGEFNLSIARLRETLQALSESTREVSNASTEISESTTDLSQRAEEQASTLERTSGSLKDISAMVQKNAENAQRASQSAVSARDIADHNGQIVAKAVDAMGGIKESSSKISDIIGVIDEIARQTNLLALNAAVEAARAGEAGRGFAVVATEVRSLAQRSAQAAKDIKELITHSAARSRMESTSSTRPARRSPISSPRSRRWPTAFLVLPPPASSRPPASGRSTRRSHRWTRSRRRIPRWWKRTRRPPRCSISRPGPWTNGSACSNSMTPDRGARSRPQRPQSESDWPLRRPPHSSLAALIPSSPPR